MRLFASIASIIAALGNSSAPAASADNCGNVRIGKTSKGEFIYQGKFYTHKVRIETDNSLCKEKVVVDWSHTCKRIEGDAYTFHTSLGPKKKAETIEHGLLSREEYCDARLLRVYTEDAWGRELRTVPILPQQNAQTAPAAIVDKTSRPKADPRIVPPERPNPELIPDAQTCFDDVDAFATERTRVCAQDRGSQPECERALAFDNASLIEGCGKRPPKLP